MTERLISGGFQTASVIRNAIGAGQCDDVTIARSLIANPNFVEIFRQGLDLVLKPCSYCNRSLIQMVENPLECHDEARFASRDEILRDIMSV